MYIDSFEIENIMDKSNIYVRDANLIISEFKTIFNELPYLYITKNTSKLNTLRTDMNLSLEKMVNNSSNNTIVFYKVMKKYERLSRETSQKFGELGDSSNGIFKSNL